jgi:PAT family beta-lactamase induction signal transducer AmpG
MGYVNVYLVTTAIAFQGVILFWYKMLSGPADLSIGPAGKETQEVQR